MGYIACIRKIRNAYKILIEKPKQKRPLIGYKCRWEDNIRMDLREMGGKVWTGYI